MSKPIFQTLGELNQLDCNNNTSYVQVLPPENVISVNKKGNHGEITFGCPPNIPIEVMEGNDLRMVCLIIDGKKFDEVKEQI